jgi:hypothetical protein
MVVPHRIAIDDKEIVGLMRYHLYRYGAKPLARNNAPAGLCSRGKPASAGAVQSPAASAQGGERAKQNTIVVCDSVFMLILGLFIGLGANLLNQIQVPTSSMFYWLVFPFNWLLIATLLTLWICFWVVQIMDRNPPYLME